MNLEELEKLRIKGIKYKRIFGIIPIIISLIVIIPLIIMGYSFSTIFNGNIWIFLPSILVISFFILLVAYAVGKTLSLEKLNDYYKAINNYIFNNYPNYIVGNGSFNNQLKLPEEYTNKIFGENNKFFTVKNEGVITGNFFGPMIMSNILVNYDISEGRGNGRYHIINGLWITCTLNKSYPYDLMIIKGHMLKDYLKVDTNYVRVGIDNSKYNELLTIYSNNREEVRSMFTSEFITALDNMIEKFGRNMILLISNNQLHLALDCDMFNNYNYKQPFDLNNCILKYQEILKPIFDFIKIIGE